jgi:exonuclease-1
MSQILKMSNLVVTQDYIENFKKADKTFKYQIVFDPLKRQLVPLNEYGTDIDENENITFAGT